MIENAIIRYQDGGVGEEFARRVYLRSRFIVIESVLLILLTEADEFWSWNEELDGI